MNQFLTTNPLFPVIVSTQSDISLLEIIAQFWATKIKCGQCVSVSILPISVASGIVLKLTTLPISSASSEEIKYQGQLNLEFELHCLKWSFQWNFMIADVTCLLLSFDFFNKFDTDCKNKIIQNTILQKLSLLNYS